MILSDSGFKRFTEKYAIQLIAVLALFVCYHSVSQHIFFEGFLTMIKRLNNVVFGTNAPSLFRNNPYHSFSIVLSALYNPWFLCGLLSFYIPLFIKRKLLLSRQVVFDKASRWIILVAAVALAWELTTYDYNYYLGHAFYFDRVILVLLAVLLFRYPLLSPLFLAFSFVYRSQFNYPVEGFPLYDIQVLFDVQIMFAAHTCARLFIPSFRVPFLYFILCVVGANYLMPGVRKLAMQPYIYGWVVNNDPGYLFTNVHYRGWLSQTSDKTIWAIAAVLSRYRIVLQGIVLLAELAGLFLLRSRKTAIALLICFGLVHVGIFLLGSMLFWKWMVVDITLACLLIYDNKNKREFLFTKQSFIASLIIILLSYWWLKPVIIGWYDTPLNQYFTYEVTTAGGGIYELDKNEMNPYHQWYQFDNFLFLVNKPVIPVSGFGYTTVYETACAVKNGDAEGFKSLEARSGVWMYDSVKKKQYDSFVKTYFMNRNQRLNDLFIPSYLQPPNHLYTYSKTGGYKNRAIVQSFRVIFNQVYTQNGKKIILGKYVVDDIAIPNCLTLEK